MDELNEVTQLKLRIMALERSQIKTNLFLKSLCKHLTNPKLDQELSKSIKEYLDIFLNN